MTTMPITVRARAGCGSSSSPPAAQAGDDVISVVVTVGAIPPHRAIFVIAVSLEVGGGGVGQEQVDVQVEQVCDAPERLLLDLVMRFQQELRSVVPPMHGWPAPARAQPRRCRLPESLEEPERFTDSL